MKNAETRTRDRKRLSFKFVSSLLEFRCSSSSVVDPNAPFTAKQRQGCLAFLCAIPAFPIGCYMIGLTDRIGSHLDVVSVLKRGGVFSIPTAVFALIFPRFWLVPSVLYGLGYYYVTLAGDAGAAAATAFISIPILIFGGQRIGYSAPSHKDLIWIYLIGIWVAAFIAMIRLHFEKKSAVR